MRALPVVVLLVAIAGQTALLVHFASTQWFLGGDDWDFLLTRGTVSGESMGWFAPHNDHWSTAVVAIYRTLFAFFGLRHYLPYALVVIALHVGICLVLYPLLRRLGAGPWATVAGVSVVVFLGAGAEALLWDTTMNLLGSLFFGLAGLLVLVRGIASRTGPGEAATVGTRDLRVVWALLVVSLMFSGSGITVTAMVTVFALGRLGLRAARQVVSVPAAAYLLWFVLVGHTGARPLLDDGWRYLRVPEFIWTGMTGAFDNAAGIPGAGAPLLLLVLVGGLLFRGVPDGLRTLALAGTCAGVLQMVLAGFTRLRDGNEAASSGRYTYVLLVLLAPSLVVCLTAAARHVGEPRWLVMVLAGCLLVGYAANGIALERDYAIKRQQFTDPWPARVSGIAAASQLGERVLTDDPDEWFNEGFRAGLVARKEMRDEVPQGEVSAAGRLDAERLFFTSVSLKSKGLLVPTDIHLSDGFTTQMEDGAGCSNHQTAVPGAVITVATGSTGAEVGVFGPNGTIRASLKRDGVQSPQREWKVKPAVSHFVSSTARDADLQISVDQPGTYLICRG